MTFVLVGSRASSQNQIMKPLNSEEKRVILDKGTEAPFTGRFYRHKAEGTYVCRQCGAPLYRSSDKFDSGCGWPSFDDEIPGAVKRSPDPDGLRTEISCAPAADISTCLYRRTADAQNTRHCVNSPFAGFCPGREVRSGGTRKAADVSPQTDTAIFAGGCFWGVEYMLGKCPGIRSVESGYTGGKTRNSTYEEVCSHKTGHAEAVRVVFDPRQVSMKSWRVFSRSTIRPSSTVRAPMSGDQYRSEIFYRTPEQRTAHRRTADQGISCRNARIARHRLLACGELPPGLLRAQRVRSPIAMSTRNGFRHSFR